VGPLYCSMDPYGNLIVENSVTAGAAFWVSGGSSFGLYFDSSYDRVLGFAAGWAMFWNVSSGDLYTTRPDGATPIYSAAWSGDFYVYGNLYSANVSDQRTKRNVTPYTRGLADISQLNPVSFFYNGMGGTVDDGVQKQGLIAQDAQPFVPEAVYPTHSFMSEHPDHAGLPQVRLANQLSLDPARLTYALINCIKELLARVESLEARVP